MSVSDGTMVDCINGQFIMCGCSLSVACSMSSGCSCHLGTDAMESYLILRAVVLALTSMSSVLLPCPGWQLWFLGGFLCFPCCDPVGGAVLNGGAFLGWSGLPLWHFGPQCPILLHLEQWESHVGQFALSAGCCHVQLGQSLEVADGV